MKNEGFNRGTKALSADSVTRKYFPDPPQTVRVPVPKIENGENITADNIDGTYAIANQVPFALHQNNLYLDGKVSSGDFVTNWEDKPYSMGQSVVYKGSIFFATVEGTTNSPEDSSEWRKGNLPNKENMYLISTVGLDGLLSWSEVEIPDINVRRNILEITSVNTWEAKDPSTQYVPLYYKESIKIDIWDNTTIYEVGDSVQSTDNKVYISILQNLDDLPQNSPTKWQLNPSEDAAIEWYNTTDYTVGDFIYYQGWKYTCKKDNKDTPPLTVLLVGQVDINWEKITFFKLPFSAFSTTQLSLLRDSFISGYNNGREITPITDLVLGIDDVATTITFPVIQDCVPMVNSFKDMGEQEGWGMPNMSGQVGGYLRAAGTGPFRNGGASDTAGDGGVTFGAVSFNTNLVFPERKQVQSNTVYSKYYVLCVGV